MCVKFNNILLVCACLIFFSSCDKNLRQSLKLAGQNRQEMEKVLEHFRNGDDPLKYESAKFLIENMPFHSSIYGGDMEKYIQHIMKWAQNQRNIVTAYGKVSLTV